MATKRATEDPSAEVKSLLKTILILRLYELGVSQGSISKKLKIDVHVVNDFLKGVKKTHAQVGKA